MMDLTKVDEKVFMCQSCFGKKEQRDMDLFLLTIDMPVGEEIIETARLRLCKSCLKELKKELEKVI